MSTSSFSIFIIEDDPEQVRMIKEFIHHKFPTFNLRTFSTGEEGLKNINENPDMVILDHLLNSIDKSAMDGLSVLSKIKRHNHNIPVVIFSAQDNPDISARTIKSGAYDYIVNDQYAFEKLGNIIKHFSSHIILDSKIILKKLNIVLLVIAVLIIILTAVFFLSK